MARSPAGHPTTPTASSRCRAWRARKTAAVPTAAACRRRRRRQASAAVTEMTSGQVLRIIIHRCAGTRSSTSFATSSQIRGDFSSTTTATGGVSIRYEEVGPRGARLRGPARRRRPRKGDKVVFWGENRPEWIACYWGCLLAGHRRRPDRLPLVRRLRRAGDAASSTRAWSLDRRRRDRESPARPTSGATPAQWRFADLDWRPTGRCRPCRSRATTSRRSSSRRARRPSPRASSSATATCSRTSCRSNARSMKYRKYARPFHPLRFLNLLPLSHMFGQSMATQHPADGARHGDLHAQLQPARHRPA